MSNNTTPAPQSAPIAAPSRVVAKIPPAPVASKVTEPRVCPAPHAFPWWSTEKAQQAMRDAQAELAACEEAEKRAKRAAYEAEEATKRAGDELAVAMVMAGGVPSEFRLCDAARLNAALRNREGVETGAPLSGAKRPGPGFMHVYIGLLGYWMPFLHWCQWKDELEAKRKAGK